MKLSFIDRPRWQHELAALWFLARAACDPVNHPLTPKRIKVLWSTAWRFRKVRLRA